MSRVLDGFNGGARDAALERMTSQNQTIAEQVPAFNPRMAATAPAAIHRQALYAGSELFVGG